jgi:hypothetical protein
VLEQTERDTDRTDRRENPRPWMTEEINEQLHLKSRVCCSSSAHNLLSSEFFFGESHI